MQLRKGQKIYKGRQSVTVHEVNKSGKTVIVEDDIGHQRLMRMSTIDSQWSATKPAKK